MHLYLDANILVDVALRRVDGRGSPLWAASTMLLDDIYKGKNIGSVNILSLYVVYVLLNPRDTRNMELVAKEKLGIFRSFLKVIDLTDDVLEESLRENRLMLEDAIQFVAAKKVGAEAIVTRNLHHFSRVKDEIKLFTPEELVNEFIK